MPQTGLNDVILVRLFRIVVCALALAILV